MRLNLLEKKRRGGSKKEREKNDISLAILVRSRSIYVCMRVGIFFRLGLFSMYTIFFSSSFNSKHNFFKIKLENNKIKRKILSFFFIYFFIFITNNIWKNYNKKFLIILFVCWRFWICLWIEISLFHMFILIR